MKNAKNDRQKSRGETFFFYHHLNEQTYWGNNDELLIEAKRFRKYKKEGKLIINEANHREFEIDGKTFYTFVVQDTNEQNNQIDPLGLGVGFMVSGMIYFFVRKENRDNIYKWIMKD
jgi:hypothetical protein